MLLASHKGTLCTALKHQQQLTHPCSSCKPAKVPSYSIDSARFSLTKLPIRPCSPRTSRICCHLRLVYFHSAGSARTCSPPNHLIFHVVSPWRGTQARTCCPSSQAVALASSAARSAASFTLPRLPVLPSWDAAPGLALLRSNLSRRWKSSLRHGRERAV